MKNSVVSERYAQALFELASETKTTEKIQQDLKDIVKLLKEHDDLKNLLFHPVINSQDKKEMLNKLFKGKVTDSSLNFLLLLIDKKRESLVEEITELYDTMVNNLHSKVVAQVYTAIEVQKADLEVLKQRLEKYLSKNVEMETFVDGEIVGGVLVKIGDRIIDGTLKTKFENMAKTLQ